MFQRVKAVEPQPELTLKITFLNGAIKQYDVKPLLALWEPFRALTQIHGLFDQVKVDLGGYGISWNEDIDLSCDELWEHGTAWQH